MCTYIILHNTFSKTIPPDVLVIDCGRVGHRHQSTVPLAYCVCIRHCAADGVTGKLDKRKSAMEYRGLPITTEICRLLNKLAATSEMYDLVHIYS